MVNNDICVRVVVLNFNQPEYTIATVNALKLQTVRNLEIVVVDNNSTEKNFARLKDALPNEILIRSESNYGYAVGNNLGCKYNSERPIDYYFILNNDVIIENTNLIQSLVTAINKNHSNRVVAVSPLVDTVSSELPINEQIQVRRIVTFLEQIIVNSPIMNKIFIPIYKRYIYKDKMPYSNRYTTVDTINGAAFLIRGDVFRENNFFDNGTFLFHEELILGKQLKNSGYNCVLDGFSSLKHLQGVSTNSQKRKFNLKMEKEKVRSEIYYFKKYFNISDVVLAFIKLMRYTEIYLLFSYRNIQVRISNR